MTSATVARILPRATRTATEDIRRRGSAAFQRGRLTEAGQLFRRVLRITPNDATAHFNLGVVYHEAGDAVRAASCYRRAVALRPAYAEAWTALSSSLFTVGDVAGAAGAARTAVSLAPSLVGAAGNLSVALHRLGDEHGALQTTLECVERNPGSAEAWFWVAQTLQIQGELQAAIAGYERAIAIDPDHVRARYQCGMSRLALGDFARGWPEYEWRLRRRRVIRPLDQPRWRGESLAGHTLLVVAEQGLGDAIQMLRYIEPLADVADRVIVEVAPALLPLVPRRDNVIAVQRNGILPPFDFYCPLLSLPLAFGTTEDSIPGRPSYLTPDPVRVRAWEDVLARPGTSRRCGIAWAGSRTYVSDRERSLDVAALAPLFAIPDVAWFSLQVGPAAVECDGAMIDLAPHLRDFGETAAVIAGLDLVVTVDTAVGHLAGAIGTPVWILVPSPPDWRWQLDREDSPWYPSARLFRQRVPGVWAEVITRVVAALRSGA